MSICDCVKRPVSGRNIVSYAVETFRGSIYRRQAVYPIVFRHTMVIPLRTAVKISNKTSFDIPHHAIDKTANFDQTCSVFLARQVLVGRCGDGPTPHAVRASRIKRAPHSCPRVSAGACVTAVHDASCEVRSAELAARSARVAESSRMRQLGRGVINKVRRSSGLLVDSAMPRGGAALTRYRRGRGPTESPFPRQRACDRASPAATAADRSVIRSPVVCR
jgi:hypothetical protein